MADLDQRMAEARSKFEIDAEQLFAFLVTESSPMAYAVGALACKAPNVTTDAMCSKLTKEFKGIPTVLASVLLHRCRDLDEACATGHRLLAMEGRVPMVGHALLRMSTLYPVPPDPSSWKPGASEEITEGSWGFPGDLPSLDYRTLFSRALSDARGRYTTEDCPQPIRNMLKLVYFRGGHPRPQAFWEAKPEDVPAWLSQMPNNLTLRDVQELIYGAKNLVEAYLIAVAPGSPRD